MNTSIDIKSALLGLLLGILAMIAVGASLSPGPVGRYQVMGTGNHGLVLDTATGQVWSTFFSPNGGRSDGETFFQPKLGMAK